MKYKKITISLFMITILLIMQFSVICLPANAKPTKPTLKDEPKNGQILPFYEVWLRWNDVSNEAVCYTLPITGSNLVPLIMNSGESLATKINVSEKNHIKLLWGE